MMESPRESRFLHHQRGLNAMKNEHARWNQWNRPVGLTWVEWESHHCRDSIIRWWRSLVVWTWISWKTNSFIHSVGSKSKYCHLTSGSTDAMWIASNPSQRRIANGISFWSNNKQRIILEHSDELGLGWLDFVRIHFRESSQYYGFANVCQPNRSISGLFDYTRSNAHRFYCAKRMSEWIEYRSIEAALRDKS